MSSASNSPPDDYFNDLSQPTGKSDRNKQQSPTHNMDVLADAAANNGDPNAPKPKRIACIICRKRKLKCDGTKPSCSTCTRLGHNCAYDEVRRKSGPKRGYVKALEERLKQVETLLKTQEPVNPAPQPDTAPKPFGNTNTNTGGPQASQPNADFNISNPSIGVTGGVNTDRWDFTGTSPQAPLDDLGFANSMTMNMGLDDNTFTWEMIGLGLEEPLPPQETIDELHQIYFDKIHPSTPMIHKYRYLAAMNLAPNQRPPVTLRYAMWTLAASVVEKFMDLRDHFYQRSRKYMELDTLKGHGEHMISVAHAQTHTLLASYEFKMMYFPRAWMSTGSAIRMCQMMGLHRLDGVGLDVKQCLPAPRDWTEREERRRTFWMAFCEDRYASIGTGWPMNIDEKDILTDLPASDEAFEMSKPESTQSLTDSMSPTGASRLSAFAGVVLMACLFGRNLIHLHRPDADDRDHDLNGEFWKRHRNMDNILLNTSLSMPSHLKLPNGLSSPNIVFVTMNIHTSTICLHQAAIYKADKNKLPASISAESKVRCITAANEIASVMRMISHMDLSAMNPFISFCLYVAARVFVQYLKSRPDDGQIGDSLRFLLSAMNALKRKNPLTESFLVQLDVDLESLGMRNPKYKSVFAYSDDNLGISSAKAPQLGNRPTNRSQNQCIFLPLSDGPDAMENTQSSNDLHNNIDQPNWISLDSQQNPEPDTQRTIPGLVLGSLPTGGYNTGNISSSGYINSESTSTAADSGPSPDVGASNRPTPNSNISSDAHSSLQPDKASSRHASYETSPATSADNQNPAQHETRTFQSFFSNNPDYTNIPTSGLTPETNFPLPETPGRDFQVPQGWEMSGQTTGLTPVGEGVFRHLMGLGPMEPIETMDLGWEGG
ncbi:fungal specific transcription factor [Phlyctema vagabunda]|uniref:Fungal specific transcription factor n=1 Tax=Phlyctema vagabunda TaxID=108571 RepID=A0ABR4PWY8_9HELO